MECMEFLQKELERNLPSRRSAALNETTQQSKKYVFNINLQ
jgi:hypothetical protein